MTTRDNYFLAFGLLFFILFPASTIAQDEAQKNEVPEQPAPPQLAKEDVAANKVQESFYKAIRSEESSKVFGLMHPELRKLVDEPILIAWMNRVNELGSVQSINSKNEAVPQNVPERAVSNANIKFDKGNATSQLESLGEQLIAFKVESEMMEDWFKGPATTDLYEEIGRTFIRRFMMQEGNSAFNMCHPALQDLVKEPVLSGMISEVTEASGDLTKITVSEAKLDFDEKKQKLLIKYHVESDKADMSCLVTFQFVGMKGHLVAFKFN